MKNLVDNKNKLLSTLTHELRTPLAVIKTSNELIMEERPGPLNETQKSLVSSSLENTKRLNALVENILSQVKVEFAWFSIKQQPLDIRTIIRKNSSGYQTLSGNPETDPPLPLPCPPVENPGGQKMAGAGSAEPDS